MTMLQRQPESRIVLPRPWHVRLRSWLRFQFYRLRHKYLGWPWPGSFKGERISLEPFEIRSGGVARWNEYGRRRFDIIRPMRFRTAMEILWGATADLAELRRFRPAVGMAQDLGASPALPTEEHLLDTRRRAAAIARRVVASFRYSGDRVPAWRPVTDPLAYYHTIYSIGKELP